MFPRHSMLRLCVEEGVGDTETMMTAELQQALAIVVHPPGAKLTHTNRPGVVIGTYSGIEVAKNEEWFLFWDSVDGSAEVIVEHILCFCQESQGWCVGTNKADWAY